MSLGDQVEGIVPSNYSYKPPIIEPGATIQDCVPGFAAEIDPVNLFSREKLSVGEDLEGGSNLLEILLERRSKVEQALVRISRFLRVPEVSELDSADEVSSYHFCEELIDIYERARSSLLLEGAVDESDEVHERILEGIVCGEDLWWGVNVSLSELFIRGIPCQEVVRNGVEFISYGSVTVRYCKLSDNQFAVLSNVDEEYNRQTISPPNEEVISEIFACRRVSEFIVASMGIYLIEKFKAIDKLLELVTSGEIPEELMYVLDDRKSDGQTFVTAAELMELLRLWYRKESEIPFGIGKELVQPMMRELSIFPRAVVTYAVDEDTLGRSAGTIYREEPENPHSERVIELLSRPELPAQFTELILLSDSRLDGSVGVYVLKLGLGDDSSIYLPVRVPDCSGTKFVYEVARKLGIPETHLDRVCGSSSLLEELFKDRQVSAEFKTLSELYFWAMLLIGSLNGRSLTEILSVTINYLKGVDEESLRNHIGSKLVPTLDSALYGMGLERRNYVVPSLTLAPLAPPRQGKSTLVGTLKRLLDALYPGGRIGSKNPANINQRSLDLVAPTGPVEGDRGVSIGEYLALLNRVPRLPPSFLTPTMIFLLMIEELGIVTEVGGADQSPLDELSKSGSVDIVDAPPLGFHCDIVTEQLLRTPKGGVAPMSDRIPTDGIDALVLASLLLVNQSFYLTPASPRYDLPPHVLKKVALFTGDNRISRVPEVSSLPRLVERWPEELGIRESLLFGEASAFVRGLKSGEAGGRFSRIELSEQLVSTFITSLMVRFSQLISVYSCSLVSVKGILESLGDFNRVASLLNLPQGSSIKRIMGANVNQRLKIDPAIFRPLLECELIEPDQLSVLGEHYRF